MSKVVSLRLRDEQVERLGRAARQIGRTPSETAAVLLEESLRQREFAFVEFRDSAAGRQAYLKGSRIAVWQIVWLIRSFDGDAERAAWHLEIPIPAARAALTYGAAYSSEIEAAISDNAQSEEQLRRLIPDLHVVKLDAAAP